MSLFFTYASDSAIIAYWIAVGVTVLYTGWKLTHRKYIFSPYTIVVYTFAFALLIVAPYQYNDAAWQVLNRPAAAPFFPYLDLSVGVNAMGFAIVMVSMWWTESRPIAPRRPPFVPKPPFIAISTVAFVLTVGVLVFAGCLAAVGTIPLFGDRTVFNTAQSIRPIYNFANYLILFTTSVLIVWSFINRSRRYIPIVLIGLLCMLATGGRTSFLSAAQLAFLMWIYGRSVGRTLRATWITFGGLAGFAIVALFLAAFRTGSDFDLAGAVDTALYANTFSDVRDGAYIASAWDRYMGMDSLEGNTFLAGIMSFLPSSVSEFRTTWSWGYFTTSTLFGFTDHYGFRGGWSFEMFMNFGVPGVIVAALACGWLLGRLESMFHAGVVLGRAAWYPNAYTWSWIGYGIFTVLIASSATYNLYSLVIIIAVLWFLTQVRAGLRRNLNIGPDNRAPDHVSAST